MVRCSRCGVEVDDSFATCPNCGNDLAKKANVVKSQSINEIVCSNCGARLNENVEFCSSCGNKIEKEDENKCLQCGSALPENVLFCPTCGAKVKQKPKIAPKICPSCGSVGDNESVFCPECGANMNTGEKPQLSVSSTNQSFADKIDFERIIKPTIISLIVSVILSLIGLAIGFSWVSFIIAIIISVGFFAGLIDNEANAIVSGLFVGLILGILENPLVEFMFGSLVAIFYDWFFGSQLIFLIIISVVIAYVSNVYLKEHIQNIAGDLASKF